MNMATLSWLAPAPVLAAITLGYDGTRLLQIFVLALPAWMWLCWPSQNRLLRGTQAAAAAVFGLIFVVDSAIRAFTQNAYDAHPSSSMIMAALANTTPLEVSEFLTMHWPSLLAWTLFVVTSLLLHAATLWFWWHTPPKHQKTTNWKKATFILLLALVVIAHASKPWRKHHPLIYWPSWMQEVTSLQTHWSNLGQQRQLLMGRARQSNIATTTESPDTLVLIISESINRNHLSLYGYTRNTTPALQALRDAQPDAFRVFKHAWSVDASTVPALQNFFYFGQADEAKQHLLALAASAGYQTHWISNHDDLAIEQEHAQMAHRVHLINSIPGRSSQSLDQSALPLLEQALQDPAPRKLIILHLLGAHPHYALRYPKGRAIFHNVTDAVYEGLKTQGRSTWVRKLRNDYDSAVHYHDAIVSETLTLTQRLGGNAVWVLFSDHGQEVGGNSDRAGHSDTTADGYRIPLLVWGSPMLKLPEQTFRQPVRADWLGHSLIKLLRLEWPGYRPEKDVLDLRYQWTDPKLPVQINFHAP